MNYFANLNAQLKQLNAQLQKLVADATAGIPKGESGTWVNGKKVASWSVPIGTNTTIKNGVTETRTVSLTDSMANFNNNNSISVLKFDKLSTEQLNNLVSRGY